MAVFGLLVVGLLVVAVVVERQLAARELRRLTATETFANLDGARVRYRLCGKEHRQPAVVFLNGTAASVEQFARIQPEVAAFAPVIAYDRAGYGFNAGGQAHSAGEQAAEIVRLLAAIGVDGPVALLGYSNAASIARVFADRYPEKVAGILYLDPFLPEVESRVPSVHSQYRLYARSLLRENTLTLLGLKRLGRALGGGQPTLSPDEERIEAIRGRFAHWWAVTREMLATHQTHREALSARVPDHLPMIVMHTLGPEGDAESRANLVLYAELAARSTRSSVRAIGSDIEHAALFDHQKTIQPIVQALRELSQPGP